MNDCAQSASGIEAERDELRAEVERLRRRLAKVEGTAAAALGTESKRMEQDLLAQQAVLWAFLDNTPALMFVKDLEGRFVLVNEEYTKFAGRSSAELLGHPGSSVLAAADVPRMDAADRRALTEGRMQFAATLTVPDGSRRTFMTVKFPIRDERGEVFGVGTVAIDMSREQEAEQARAALQETIIAAQEATIRELTIPLLPIADHVVAMPLVGTINERRAQQILDALLEGITRHQATVAILDVTGIRIVDTHVAQALVHAAQAAKLLGAEVVLTGMSPAIARTLVDLGADLQGIVTLGTLQSGIAWAIRGRR
ncbi:PAS domain-containing protein [Polyangium mundeleinium]|uniref:PAS domain-containing protein n=1 Tax=Polyangium mundeleinium TaxID=2995306 RepID=A0ABT5EFD9_9BACT|nr:PAS domain-containing protein [Polyangium mundeleinium]MDC0740520.1 PAS domain-containing protein [Polyangium mundeleinium]